MFGQGRQRRRRLGLRGQPGKAALPLALFRQGARLETLAQGSKSSGVLSVEGSLNRSERAGTAFNGIGRRGVRPAPLCNQGRKSIPRAIQP